VRLPEIAQDKMRDSVKVAQYFSAGYGSMIVFPSRWDDRIVSPPGLAGLPFSVVRKVAFE
jgi:hypothetical protein